MPLEIKELHISVSVNQPGAQSNSTQAGASPTSKDKNEKEALINQCVEQVMDILKTKQER